VLHTGAVVATGYHAYELSNFTSKWFWTHSYKS